MCKLQYRFSFKSNFVYLSILQPLVGIVSGLECMQTLVAECAQAMRSSGQIESAQHAEGARLMNETLANLRGITSLMFSAVNRALDYTKASRGIALVPKNETVHLTEAVQLPLSCLKGLQSRVAVSLDYIGVDVCPFVITDLQWLQENVMCLLSNAVKYSSAGEVRLKVSLTCFAESAATPRPGCQTCGCSGTAAAKIDYGVSPMRAQELKEEQTPCLLFEVEDTGIGISEDKLATLFAPFRQA